MHVTIEPVIPVLRVKKKKNLAPAWSHRPSCTWLTNVFGEFNYFANQISLVTSHSPFHRGLALLSATCAPRAQGSCSLYACDRIPRTCLLCIALSVLFLGVQTLITWSLQRAAVSHSDPYEMCFDVGMIALLASSIPEERLCENS